MKSTTASCDLARIKSVIEGDRKNVSADVEKMLKYDLTCVVGGYFDLLTKPKVDIYSSDGAINLRVTVSARGMKNAGVPASDAGGIR